MLLVVGIATSFLAGADGPRLAVEVAGARLDRPGDAPLWTEGRLSGGWMFHGSSVDLAWRRVDRWDRVDDEIGATLSRSWGKRIRTGVEATKGRADRYLPSWSAKAEMEGVPGGGWVVAGSWKESDYDGFTLHIPAARIDRYLGRWRFGAEVSAPWHDGAGPGWGGKASLGWDWSDAGGWGVTLASDRESERIRGGVADRNSLSATTVARQRWTENVNLFAATGWTRLRGVHDRLELRLGVLLSAGP